ncbi:unnamed protein product, partial [Gulo gulo]
MTTSGTGSPRRGMSSKPAYRWIGCRSRSARHPQKVTHAWSSTASSLLVALGASRASSAASAP